MALAHYELHSHSKTWYSRAFWLTSSLLHKAYPVAAILALASLFIAATWVVDRRPALEAAAPETPPPVVAAGWDVTVTSKFLSRREGCESVVYAVVEDSKGGSRFGVTPYFLKDGAKSVSSSFHVPRSFSPGAATYNAHVYSMCNPTHRFRPIVDVISIPFTVIDPQEVNP